MADKAGVQVDEGAGSGGAGRGTPVGLGEAVGAGAGPDDVAAEDLMRISLGQPGGIVLASTTRGRSDHQRSAEVFRRLDTDIRNYECSVSVLLAGTHSI